MAAIRIEAAGQMSYAQSYRPDMPRECHTMSSRIKCGTLCYRGASAIGDGARRWAPSEPIDRLVDVRYQAVAA
jgi:hypothetical protein